jgi:hypothetical protein
MSREDQEHKPRSLCRLTKAYKFSLGKIKSPNLYRPEKMLANQHVGEGQLVDGGDYAAVVLFGGNKDGNNGEN